MHHLAALHSHQGCFFSPHLEKSYRECKTALDERKAEIMGRLDKPFFSGLPATLQEAQISLSLSCETKALQSSDTSVRCSGRMREREAQDMCALHKLKGS